MALMRTLLICGFCGVILAVTLLLGRVRTARSSSVSAPQSVLICGLQDRPCVSYTISFHEPTAGYGDSQGEGVTDYEQKTISIARSGDHFKNVEAVEHEVFHAVLWERGFQDTEQWDVHAWIYFSEGAFPLLFHDNPDLVKYITTGY
jgi:hypothetical protein